MEYAWAATKNLSIKLVVVIGSFNVTTNNKRSIFEAKIWILGEGKGRNVPLEKKSCPTCLIGYWHDQSRLNKRLDTVLRRRQHKRQ